MQAASRRTNAPARAVNDGGLVPAATVAILLMIAMLCLATHGLAESNGAPVRDEPSAQASFSVGERLDKLYFYPCADCHAFMDPNTEVRELDVEEGHPAKIEHGDGQIWCLSCHGSADYGQLRNLLAEPVDFDQGFRVCSGCHSQKFRDWTYGGHGKRAANWRGERTLYSCVECHNPHEPAIQPRAPKPPPPIRAGLEPMPPAVIDEVHSALRPRWEQIHAE